MDEWPESWAGVNKDVPVGKAMVQWFCPFVLHLQAQGLARETVRRHLNNLWLLGGEIIRELNYDSRLRRKPPEQLLFDAIKGGWAPTARDATDAEQEALDATARKLFKFLSAHKLTTAT